MSDCKNYMCYLYEEQSFENCMGNDFKKCDYKSKYEELENQNKELIEILKTLYNTYNNTVTSDMLALKFYENYDRVEQILKER